MVMFAVIAAVEQALALVKGASIRAGQPNRYLAPLYEGKDLNCSRAFVRTSLPVLHRV